MMDEQVQKPIEVVEKKKRGPKKKVLLPTLNPAILVDTHPRHSIVHGERIIETDIPKLAPREKAFADSLIVNGGDGQAVAKALGYNHPYRTAQKIMAKPQVQAYINYRIARDKRAFVAARVTVLDMILADIMEYRIKAREDVRYAIPVGQRLEMLAKLMGLETAQDGKRTLEDLFAEYRARKRVEKNVTKEEPKDGEEKKIELVPVDRKHTPRPFKFIEENPVENYIEKDADGNEVIKDSVEQSGEDDPVQGESGNDIVGGQVPDEVPAEPVNVEGPKEEVVPDSGGEIVEQGEIDGQGHADIQRESEGPDISGPKETPVPEVREVV